MLKYETACTVSQHYAIKLDSYLNMLKFVLIDDHQFSLLYTVLRLDM